jgi:UDP-N-acetylmuramoylalanine--D-glutamate ligase
MVSFSNLKDLSFLVYGLGTTGQSVVKFFKKNKVKNYQVWDDKNKKLFRNKRALNLDNALRKVNYIILSPGVSLSKSKNKLIEYKNKIITDIDLLFLLNKDFKSIVVTGTNGKSTTCKMINHLLKTNKFKTLLGGNIGTPVLNLNLKKNAFLVIEASSYQLSHSKFICPDYAFLLNITNDHIDWHGNMNNYVNSKFKIFKLQKKNQYAFINNHLKKKFKKKKFLSKLIIPNLKDYKKLKSKIKNIYIKSNINDENMSNVFRFSKLLNISKDSFIKSLNTFVGLPHRYEIFLKRKNINFINDSKATSFQATKFALQNSKNIFWIVGGLQKKNDKIILENLKTNIIKSYIIGKNINFFKKQIKNKINFYVAKSLKNSIVNILKDIKLFKKEKITILFSPAAASFDQFVNFEKRGEEFKKLSKYYARRYI